MKYILLFIIAYFVFRGVGRMLKTLNLDGKSKTEVEGGKPSEKRFGVDESDVEDAEFKDVE